MNKFLTSIINWFKAFFGIKTENKAESEYDSDFYDEDMSVTAALAERLATLCLSDNEINIIGDNARSEYVRKFADWFNDTKLDGVAQICLGTGDCLAKPNTDGRRIGVDLIPNDCFRITESIGDYLGGVVIKCDEIQTESRDIYERWEYHKMNETEEGTPYVSITQVAFKNGTQIPISQVDAWAGLKDNQIVPNVDRLMFGRFKCPKLNRGNINSATGVPVTYGNDYIVESAKTSYLRFNSEYEKSDKIVFADKRVFKSKKVRNTDGTTTEECAIPKGKEAVIMTVNGSTTVDGQPLIHEYNPEIRSEALVKGIQENLKLLEIFVGLDTGILSDSDNKYVNLDETRKSVQATFAFITKLRKVIKTGVDDLLYAVNAICNINNITPMGNFEVDYNWSDSFIENSTERFNQLLQAHGIGAVTTAEVRSWVMDIDLDIAEEQLTENID